ncbi:MAG: hypothetical protein ACSLE6_06440 [Mycobacterium sp.]
MTTTTDTGTDADLAEVTDTPEAEPTADGDRAEPDATAADAAEDAAEDAVPDDKLGRDAAKYRRRLRDAEATIASLEVAHGETVASLEAAHAATADTLTRQRQAILDATLANAGLDSRLAIAAGIKVDALLAEDGLLDGAKMTEAITGAVAEFGVSPKRNGPQPNPQQGQVSSPPSGKGWSDVIPAGARSSRARR